MKNIILTSALLLSCQAFAKKPVILSPFDVLSSPQNEVELKVKVEQEKVFPFRPDIENAIVRFLINDHVMGTAKTDDDGFAKFKIDTSAFDLGEYEIRVELLPSREFEEAKDVLQLTLLPKDQKIIVTDVDQTISNVDNINVVLLPVSFQKPFENSVDVLQELKDLDYKIVYLTAREDALFQRTKCWLSYHKFPAGHLIMWDVDILKRTPWNHGEFKTEALKKLKVKFPNIMVGFGDKPHDIEAYKKNGIPALLKRSRFNENLSFPDGTVEFKNWFDIWDIVSL